MRSWWPADAGSAANEWLGSVRCKPTTAETYRLVIGKHMLPALGKRPAFAVGHKEAMELHHALSAQPMTANRAVEFLSRIFNADENRGQIPERSYPCLPAGGQGPRARKRERFLTDEELRRLGRMLDVAETCKGVSVHPVAATRLLLLTGCCKGEILNHRWD